MKPAPFIVDGATVLYSALLAELPHTGAIRHYRGGEEQVFVCLLIAKYQDEDCHYLFYCDQEWEVQNDTLHDSLEEAIESAERQFPGVKERLCRICC